MNRKMKQVLDHIHTKFSDRAMAGARHYLTVDLNDAARDLGYPGLFDTYQNREVIISLKEPLPGMKVRIDGRTFVNYAEFADGFAVPARLARKAGLPARKYIANDSMILNFV